METVMRNSFMFPLTLAALVSTPGCATMLKSKQAEVSVTSTTPGADVLVNGAKVGTTPTQVKLSAKEDHTITVRSGATEQSCQLRSGASTKWIVLDVLTAGGWLVDLVTHNWNDLDKATCSVTL